MGNEEEVKKELLLLRGHVEVLSSGWEEVEQERLTT